MKAAPGLGRTVPVAPQGCSEADGTSERLESRFGGGDPFGPLDSDDIEWLQQQEAKRASQEIRRCSSCGTTFHPVSPYAEECPALAKHAERCRDATPGERAFYRSHRRWPRPGQVDASNEEAA